eukprot:TRINITY_DN2016_c0_g1_i3.p1 TRINITY_DN2016_c0_g1~~TRINITY_DN2016_c0_g1_i3.p1  ORF type:complete len:340 (-),score=15.06 TRINITY_DN2016_c0_g1_i3:173-1192(-)
MASRQAHVLLIALVLCCLAAGHTPRRTAAFGDVTVPITVPGTNTTFNYTGPNTTDILIGILNGSIPIGRIQSLLFTQMNRFNMYTINGAAVSPSIGFRASARKPAKKLPPPKVPQPNNTVAVGSNPNNIPPGATVQCTGGCKSGSGGGYGGGGGSGSGSGSMSGSGGSYNYSYSYSYSYYYYYDVDCHGDDEEEDEDAPEVTSEPLARVRIQMYTSVNNITFVRFRVKSKWLNNVRTVQIRQGTIGKTGPLVMTLQGSWRLTKAKKFRLSFQTFVVNASHVKTDTGKNLTKVIQDITKAPWNYYAMLTTKELPNGALRGQLWKPYCPPMLCNSTWWGLN